MRIVFTDHAKTNLILRGIDGWKAKEVVKSPTWKKVQNDGSIVARKDFEGKMLEVAYIEDDNERVIKTAYYAD